MKSNIDNSILGLIEITICNIKIKLPKNIWIIILKIIEESTPEDWPLEDTDILTIEWLLLHNEYGHEYGHSELEFNNIIANPRLVSKAIKKDESMILESSFFIFCMETDLRVLLGTIGVNFPKSSEPSEYRTNIPTISTSLRSIELPRGVYEYIISIYQIEDPNSIPLYKMQKVINTLNDMLDSNIAPNTPITFTN